MARKLVGTVVIDGHVDTTRMRQETVRGAKIAGEAGEEALSSALADIDTTELLARIKVLKEKIEATLSRLDAEVRLDDSGIKRQLVELDARLRAEQIELLIDPQIDEDGFLVDLNELRARIQAFDETLKVDAELDQDAYIDLVSDVEQVTERVHAKIEAQLELDEAQALAEIKEAQALANFNKAILEMTVEANVNEVSDAALAEQQRLFWESVNPVIDVKPELDEKAAALARAEALVEGKKAGDAYDRGFGQGQGGGRGLSLRTKAIIAGVAVLIEPAFVAVEGLGAALTALSGTALAGVTSAASGAGVAMVALGGAMTAVVVGSQGVGTAMGAVNEEFKDATEEGRAFDITATGIQKSLATLAPEAQDTVVAFADMRGALSGVSSIVQGRLFDGMADVLGDINDDLPDIAGGLSIAADSANDFAKELVAVATEADFTGLFLDLEPVLDNLVDVSGDLASTVLKFLESAAPAAEEFTGWLADGAEALEEWVTLNPDNIADFLEDGQESLEAWVTLLGSTVDLLATVFAAGQDSGNDYLTTLDKIVTRWDDWLETVEGQNALEEFFEGGERILSAFTPVLEGLAEAFDVLVTDETIARFEELGSSVGAALPVLAEFFLAFGESELLITTIEALITVFEVLQPVIDLAATIMREFGFVIVPLVLSLKAASAALGVVAIATKFLTGKTRLLKIELISTDAAAKALSVSAGLIGVAALAATAVVAVMSANATATRKAKEEVEEYINALQGVEGAGQNFAVIETVLVNLQDEQESTRDFFDDLRLSVGEWAREVVVGTKSADEAFADWIATAEGGGEVARIFDETGVSIREVQTALENVDNGRRSLASLEGPAGDAARAMVELEGGVRGSIEVLDFLGDESEELATSQDEVARRARDVGDALTEEVEIMAVGVITARSLTSATSDVALADRLAADAIRDSNEALLTRTELYDAAEQASIDYAEATEGYTTGIGRAIVAQDEMNEALSIFGDTIDLLVSPFLDAAAAADAFQGDLNSIGETAAQNAEDYITARVAQQELTGEFGKGITSLAELAEKAEAYSVSLTGNTDAARANREELRANVEGALASADAALAQGESLAVVEAQLLKNRDAILLEAESKGFNLKETKKLLREYGFTPAAIQTIFDQPGLAEGVEAAEKFRKETGKAKKNVKTAYDFEGLPEGVIAAESLGLTQDEIDGTKIETEWESDIEDQQDLVDTYDQSLADLPPEISIPFDAAGLSDLIDDIGTLDVGIGDLDTSYTFTMNTIGLVTAISQVQTLDAELDGVNGRVVTFTVNQNGVGLPGGMTGGIVAGETVMRVGERGLAEAIVPLQLPLNRVDPSVREMARLIRGGSPKSSGGASQTNHFNITSNDGRQVADMVSNRLTRAFGS